MKKSVLIGVIVAAVVLVAVVLGVVLGTPNNNNGATTTTTVSTCKHDDPTQIVVIEAVPATCQETGLTEGMKCTLCGTMVVPQMVLNTIECIESDWIVDKKPTHTEDGKLHTECTMCKNIFNEETLISGNKKLEYVLAGETYQVKGIGTCTDTDIVIPSTYNGLPVTSIGDYAFYGRSSLTSITIPDSVTSIGSDAFEYCSSLTSIVIPDSVTSIGEEAFKDCSSLQFNEYDNAYYLGNENNPYVALIKAKNTSITNCEINGATRFILDDAFEDCSSLTSIVIPSSVTSIGVEAFYNCTSLTSITIPDSVTSIGRNAFSGCTSLTSVLIPDSVTIIGGQAFYGCTSLTSIVIPDSVTSIGSGAFRGCSSLTSIVIPDSMTSIGSDAFYDCTSLQFNEYDNAYYLGNENNPYVALIKAKNTSITNCEINGATRFILDDAFEYCSSLTSIEIPDSITRIGSFAFQYCDALTSINIPDSVTSIGGCAFYNCTSLTSITIPDSVTSIDHYAFVGCPSLTIYCEATSEPSGWYDYWNNSNRPVVWGYTGE